MSSKMVIVITILAFMPARVTGQIMFPRDAPTQPGAKSWLERLEKLPPFDPPRLPDGTPDLRGRWQGGGMGDDIEEHSYVDVTTPPQESFVSDPPDGKIPYQPWALAKRNEHRAGLGRGWPGETEPLHLDPQTFCLSAVPRAAYRGAFEILQSPGYVIIVLNWSHYYRVIPTDGRPHASDNLKLWMGQSRGRWEGDTLVVDVTNLNGKLWLDSVGNFFSDNVSLIERWRLVDANTIDYEVTINDPSVYTKPWRMSLPVSRFGTGDGNDSTTDPYVNESWEYACHEGNIGLEHVRARGFKWFTAVIPPE